ncbi:MAG TPA: SDR family NAD(P)-dependent oxidoreductase, partial [Roseimicrobium sp.]|nr:SDR family NAD(P)-dependent oxidoreductase [Roseimicrobium sp.]
MNSSSKVAIVTGASRGVGRATAVLLARHGCSVVINHRDSAEEAEVTLRTVEALGVKGRVVQGDVARDEDCRRLVREAVEAFGRIDILVNNAGTTRFIPFHDLEAVVDDDWDRLMATNVKGPFQCIRAARPHLEASGQGAVVNVASVAAFVGAGSSIPYCASKAAVVNMTIALAKTLAPKIRVNAVAPGFIDGEWLQKGLGESFQQARDTRAAQTPLQLVCKPEDIADA